MEIRLGRLWNRYTSKIRIGIEIEIEVGYRLRWIRDRKRMKIGMKT